jgi:arylsulfatase A-like enzyme
MKNGEVKVALDHMESTRQSHSSIALSCFPHYFDPDQLYDLGSDPYEQHNLADAPAYANVLADLRDTLKSELETFRHPYDLSVPEFMESERFAELVEARQEIGAGRVGWWDQSFKWPPEE